MFSFDNFFFCLLEEKKKAGGGRKGLFVTVGRERGKNLFEICRDLKENLE